jgi:hypothetical protein
MLWLDHRIVHLLIIYYLVPINLYIKQKGSQENYILFEDKNKTKF